jgi:uncharacterized protein YmfQ (DUF2313 family)
MVQDADLLTLMPTWARLQVRLNELIPEIFPCSTEELLPEWEETLGLPDPCTGQLGTLQERQAAVCARFTARGGQSKDYYIAVAAKLGFQITITEFAPFRCNVNRCGDPLRSQDWAHTWRINAFSPIVYFRTGISRCGERLATWGNRLLECTTNAIKPAHTVLLFGYREPLENDEGNPILDPAGQFIGVPE